MDRVARLSWLLALLAVPASSCVSFRWTHETSSAPVQAAAVQALQPGESDLGACLDALGAPVYVWEYRGDGAALGFGSSRGKGLGLGVRVPLANRSASMAYGQADDQTRGWVLFFDADWKLTAIRAGRLREIARGMERQPPAFVE